MSDEIDMMESVAKRVASAKRSFASAYDAGYDAGKHGPNTSNCHFGWFGSRESTSEWERGNKAGLAVRSSAPAGG